MNARLTLLSLPLVVLAVLFQTTVFHSVRPFGASPDLVLLTVIACVRWLKPEPGVLLGFTGGLMVDLFGTSPFGLYALGFTLAAYTAVNARDWFDYGIYNGTAAVGVITFVGLGAAALIGALFGEGTLGATEILRSLVLAPVYNMALGLAVLPLVARFFSLWPRSRLLPGRRP